MSLPLSRYVARDVPPPTDKAEKRKEKTHLLLGLAGSRGGRICATCVSVRVIIGWHRCARLYACFYTFR